MNYEQAKDKLLSKGIFVLDKRKSVEEIKYLINCGYSVLYARFFTYYTPFIGSTASYRPVLVNDLTLQKITDEDLYKEFKFISYSPKTIIKYARQ